jgi:hypothetical protein
MRTRGLVVLVAAIALSAFCDLSLAQNAGRDAPIFVAQRTPNQAGQASVDFKNSLFILSSFIALAALTTDRATAWEAWPKENGGVVGTSKAVESAY